MENRLQSLKLPRDLTLGGTKQPKKTYTPNLNVVRNKNKIKEIVKNNEQKKTEKIKDRRINKRHDKRQNFIQQAGVFANGAGGDLIKKSYHREKNGFKDDVPVTMSMPTIKKDSWQVNKKTEDMALDEIMDYDDESDDNEKLPFTPVIWDEKILKDTKVFITKQIKMEIKSEPKLEPDLNNSHVDTSYINIIPQEFADNKFISDYNPLMTLWSLPDSFAGKGLSDDPNVKKIFDYKLCDMLEGQIGKMTIRKSGKMEVSIGHVRYDLEPTELEMFREEIVEIDTKNNSDPSAVVLGEIQNRFILNPRWEYLLKHT